MSEERSFFTWSERPLRCVGRLHDIRLPRFNVAKAGPASSGSPSYTEPSSRAIGPDPCPGPLAGEGLVDSPSRNCPSP